MFLRDLIFNETSAREASRLARLFHGATRRCQAFYIKQRLELPPGSRVVFAILQVSDEVAPHHMFVDVSFYSATFVVLHALGAQVDRIIRCAF